MTSDEARKVLFQHADTMLPHVGRAVEVTMTGAIQRTSSRIWFAEVRSVSTKLPVVLKWRCGNNPDSVVQAPRLIPVPPNADKIRCEGEALRAMEQLIASYGEARFHAVRVHLCASDVQLLIMDRSPGEELRKRLLRVWRSKDHALCGAFLYHVESSGAWLRKFHEHVKITSSKWVFETSNAILDQAYAWMDLISPAESYWSAQFRDRIADAVNSLAPAPTAVLHGDFWPGNVIVDEGSTCIIDPIAYVGGPVWLDIAYFLIHLRAVNQQVHAQGFGWANDLLANAEERFLLGYFETEAVDEQTRWLYTVLALLAKWAGNAHTLHESRGGKRILKRIQLSWRSRYYRRLLSMW